MKTKIATQIILKGILYTEEGNRSFHKIQERIYFMRGAGNNWKRINHVLQSKP